MPTPVASAQADAAEPQTTPAWTPPVNSRPMTAHTRINANGRIVIPAAMREKLGLQPNDVIVMTLEDGALKIQSHREVIREIQQYFKPFAKPGILASDELIAERREEARREEACRETEEALG